ncbi:WW domain-containing protein [Pyrenophora tritici-repentis]|uniref:WW domain containing protein n=1 Tax=Pyrenophora tritici-repentis TaxID=45151 RepID=A0A5M9L7A1_9PLEO|nr:WW domain-containing protein [Pyrenophora tritici-repentis]KAF7568650.1 WW domain containing protein [Pyrenophora tritici-repentis]KAI0622208.1 WW domain-containing protein [Pyrenophora tritici-repentis]
MADVKTVNREGSYSSTADAPLPYEEAPPLPDEPVPDAHDDGWTHRLDPTSGCYYYVNSRTGVSQWENPRVPEATVYPHAAAYTNYQGSNYSSTSQGSAAPGMASSSGGLGTGSPAAPVCGGYNPRIHGSYDPNADYAIRAAKEEEEAEVAANPALALQQPGQGPEMHNDENKSRRQLAAYYNIDAADKEHDGRSLKAERRAKPPNKAQVKQYQKQRKEKKEAKRKAWLLN